MQGNTQHSDAGPARRHPASAARCPFCGTTAVVDFLRSRFRVACEHCDVHFELTAAAHKRAKTLPAGLLIQIRSQNERGRTPCISMPDIESCKANRLDASSIPRVR